MAKKAKGETHFLEKLSQTLNLPGEVLEGLPEIELLGNKEAVVDHCQGVLEYDEQQVRILANKLVLKFTGRGLRLNYMTQDSVMITGYITGLTFE